MWNKPNKKSFPAQSAGKAEETVAHEFFGTLMFNSWVTKQYISNALEHLSNKWEAVIQ